MSKPFKVLISGGGITGPVVAYWLARASTIAKPIHITLIERAPGVSKLGQGIDVEDTAKEIAIRMGVYDKIKSHRTVETGFQCIDNNNRGYATFAMGGLTNENEIMRGDLCEVLTDAVKELPNVELQYSRQITDIAQSDETVKVTISEQGEKGYTEQYNAVVAADGLRSKTRDLMLDPADTKGCIKTKEMLVAYFSAPSQPQDRPYARFQHALGGRSITVRPVTENLTSVYLFAVGDHADLAEALKSRDQNVQRQAWAKKFSDVQYGEFPRAIKDMLETDNFYTDQISQVKLPAWHKGRCAVVGDAAYCPSPLTGQGVVLSMLGAYVLAGELAANLESPALAFKEYEKKIRGFVEKSQNIPLGGRAPKLVNPQTAVGIWLMGTVFSIVASSRIWKLVANRDSCFPLPDYNFEFPDRES